MTFEDLPRDWATRPLTDPEITADVLDLVIRDSDRRAGSIGALICGPSGRLVQPVVMPVPQGGVPPGERGRFFDVVCQGVLAGLGRGCRGGVLVAIARLSHPFVTGEDREWRAAAQRSCDEHGVDLLGTWLVTRNVILAVDRGEGRLRSGRLSA